MDVVVWLILAFLGALGFVVLGILLYARGKRKERVTDYRMFFVLGICFFPLGIVWTTIEKLRPMGFVYFSMGVVFFLIGLANQDKWKKESKET